MNSNTYYVRCVFMGMGQTIYRVEAKDESAAKEQVAELHLKQVGAYPESTVIVSGPRDFIKQS